MEAIKPNVTTNSKVDRNSAGVAGILLWRAVTDLEYPKDSTVVGKECNLFPALIAALMTALEGEDYPSEEDYLPEGAVIKETNWYPTFLLGFTLERFCESYPQVVDNYFLPYIKTAIKVSVFKIISIVSYRLI